MSGGGTRVDIPVPPGVSAWETAMALVAELVELWHAQVTGVHDLLDGELCFEVRIPANQGESQSSDAA